MKAKKNDFINFIFLILSCLTKKNPEFLQARFLITVKQFLAVARSKKQIEK